MKTILCWTAVGVLLLGFAGCVQMPSETQGVVDMRPQISFVAEKQFFDARVLVDNVDMGRVGDFVHGTAALRIVPGTHAVRVVSGGAVLLDEKFYIGDGVSRSFSVR
jgi:hypothetical protein